MSASDAAPLPRLGEVFFDVRGNSRSMRLSWYADTGVAVFSIWQGGMCTGTFRLPIDDLPRMIDILQRGPVSGDERGRREHGHRAVDAGGPGGRGYAEPDYGDYDAGYPASQDGPEDFGPGEYDRGAHRTDRNPRPGYGADERGPGGHRAGGDRAGGDRDRTGDYGPGEHGPGGDYGPPDYGPGDYGPGDYDRPDHGPVYTGGDPGYADAPYRNPGHRAEGYGADGYGADGYGAEGHRAADYGRPDYEQIPGAPRPARWRDDDRYQADVTGQHSVAADETGYGQQRFVPPYVSPQPGSSQAGYLDDPEYRLPADPRAGTPHSAARPGGRQG
jgi:hypothetical protein